jgi:hypothetical protein
VARSCINGRVVGIGAYSGQDERATGADVAVTAGRVRGEEYPLERRLLRRLSDGRVGQEGWRRLAFPNGWHYDVGRALG